MSRKSHVTTRQRLGEKIGLFSADDKCWALEPRLLCCGTTHLYVVSIWVHFLSPGTQTQENLHYCDDAFAGCYVEDSKLFCQNPWVLVLLDCGMLTCLLFFGHLTTLLFCFSKILFREVGKGKGGNPKQTPYWTWSPTRASVSQYWNHDLRQN